MSSYVPLEIQTKIMEKLPIKSLLQLRSVSKTWRSSIADFTLHNKKSHNLIVSYNQEEEEEEDKDENVVRKYVCFVDDNTFPTQKFTPIVPPLVNLLNESIIIGSSYGLLCIYSRNLDQDDKDMVVLWNPLIRKSIGIHLPNVKISWSHVVGFGVIPDTLDPMLVQISYNNFQVSESETKTRVEVFTLSKGNWRISCSNAPPRKSIAFTGYHVVIGGFIYWMGVDIFVSKQLVVSFDMKTEEFREIHFPNHMADGGRAVSNSTIFNLNGSLVVVVPSTSDVCDVWIMEDGLFNKLYTIKAPNGLKVNSILGFRKSGEPIIAMEKWHTYQPELFVYEPCSKEFQNLEVIRGPSSFFVNSYTESFVLLDQKDNTIFPV